MGKISTKELDNQMEELRGMLTPADLWGQLAEEASELAQAALKMQRLELGNNPPQEDSPGVHQQRDRGTFRCGLLL